MGILKEQYGMQMIGQTPPGTCPMCAHKHAPDAPHNRDSLTYQYKFFDMYGVFPSWRDAMAHCDKATKIQWIVALEIRGIDPGVLHIKEASDGMDS